MYEGTSLLTMTQLKEWGWTAALVKKFLDYERASEQSDPHFLERIMVNEICHHLTEYETHLEGVRLEESFVAGSMAR